MAGSRTKTALASVAAIAAAWGIVWPVSRLAWVLGDLHRAWWSGDHSWGAFLRDRLSDALVLSGIGAYAVALVLATVLVPLGLAARTMVRAHVRAGHADPLARVRRWMSGGAGTAVAAVVPVAFTWFQAMDYFGQTNADLARYFRAAAFVERLSVSAIGGVPALLAFVVLTLLARAGLRAFVSPTVGPEEAQRDDVSRDEIAFDAVAVTVETRAAVVAMAALPFAFAALSNVLDEHKLGAGVKLGALLAYVVVALGGALLFQRASRIAVGLDGVYVTGTSRTRFFAYRELDGARVKGGALELVRGGRSILRLQLHGEDASRRQAVLERIEVAIARAKEELRDVTTDFVSSASGEALDRVAQGAGDYRAAAVSREQLWAVLEGPAIATTARVNAAEALAKTSDDHERARLRVAAEHCADPKVRVALQKLAEAPEEAEDELPPAARARRLRSV